MTERTSLRPRAAQRLAALTLLLANAAPAFAAPYAYVALLGADQVVVIDAASNDGITSIATGDDPNGVAVSPDGTRAYVTGFLSDTVSVIDTASNQVIDTVAVGDGPVGVAVHPDGTRLYVANRREDTLSVLDLSPLAERTRIAVGNGPNAVAVSPDGKTAYVTNSETRAPGEVSVIDLAEARVRTTLAVNRNPNRVAFTPDGSTAIVTSFRNWNATLIDAVHDRVETAIRLGYRPTSVVANPNGAWAYVTDLAAGVLVVDLAERRVTRSLPVGNRPWAIGVQRNGGTGYIANFYDDTVSVVDLADEVGVAEIAVGDRPFAVAVNCVGAGCSEAPYTPKPTRTPTVTPTGTIVISTATPTPGPLYVVGSQTRSAPGNNIEVSLLVQPNGTIATSAQIDLGFADGVRIAARGDGQPDCTSDFVVDPDRSGFRFLPQGCSGVACTGMSASITVLSPETPLGYGHLYRCRATIAADATPGARELPLSNLRATSAAGGEVPVVGVAPFVEVSNPQVFLVPNQPNGAPGQRAVLTVTLDTRGPQVAGTQNQINFADGVRVAAKANGRPDCAVNPSIEKNGTAFAFVPSGCRDSVCTAVRVLVLSLDSVDPIPDGAVLYSCNVGIEAGAAAGARALRLTDVGASDPDGNAIDTTANDAIVTVLGAALVAQQSTIRDRRVCSGGVGDGETCTEDADCRGGACVRPQGMCVGGADHGLRCDCPGGSCEASDGSSCGGVAEAGTCGLPADNRGACCDRTFNCGAESTCISTYRLCVRGASKGSPCDNDTDCVDSACVAFTQRCAGGLLDGTACVDDGDCPAGDCIRPYPVETPSALTPVPVASPTSTLIPDRSTSSSGGGCSVGPHSGGGAVWLLAPLALLLRRRRSPRRFPL
jgi:YVTN family beta-propeller protein